MDWCVLPSSVGATVVKRLGKVGVCVGHGRWITKAREWMESKWIFKKRPGNCVENSAFEAKSLGIREESRDSWDQELPLGFAAGSQQRVVSG